MKNLFFFITLASLLALPSCFQKPINIRSSTHSNIRKLPRGFARYSPFSVSAPDTTESHDPVKHELQTGEIAHKIELILENKNFTIKQPHESRYHLEFDYGMHVDRSVTHEAKTIPGQRKETIGGRLNNKGVVEGFTKHEKKSDTVVYVPEEQVTYTKFISIKIFDVLKNNLAHDDRNHRNASIVWSGTATITGEIDNFREEIDALIIALCDILGQNTQGTINQKIYPKDESMTWLRTTYLTGSTMRDNMVCMEA